MSSPRTQQRERRRQRRQDAEQEILDAASRLLFAIWMRTLYGV